MEMCRVGRTLREVHQLSVSLLSEGVASLGIFPGMNGAAISHSTYRMVYPHSVGAHPAPKSLFPSSLPVVALITQSCPTYPARVSYINHDGLAVIAAFGIISGPSQRKKKMQKLLWLCSNAIVALLLQDRNLKQRISSLRRQPSVFEHPLSHALLTLATASDRALAWDGHA